MSRPIVLRGVIALLAVGLPAACVGETTRDQPPSEVTTPGEGPTYLDADSIGRADSTPRR